MKKQKAEIRNNIDRNFKHWLINLTRFYYQRTIGNVICKRNPKIWVFSAWEGVKYADNAKYLFEYVNKYDEKGIRCIWLTKDEDVLKEVIEKGYEGYLIGTKKSKIVQKHAGVALRTHGLDDFGDFPYIFGAHNVHLCHGIGGNKRTYYGQRKKNKLIKLLSITKAKMFNYAYRDVTISTSSFCVEVAKIEMLSKKNIPVIGLARNDFITVPINDLSEVFSEEYIRQHNLKKDLNYITFMPTYRPHKTSQKKLENIISEIASDEKMDNMLKENNGKLVIKLHYATDITYIKCSKNVILLRDEDTKDVAKLLRLSKLLITDYSSCAMDFALKQNDIIFYAPDLDEYEKETGMYQEFINFLYKYRIINMEDLRKRIENSFEHDFRATECVAEINRLFNERSSEVGQFRKLTYEYICSIIKI